MTTHGARRDLASIVKAYDVRGLVGSELDEDVAHALGRASAAVLAPEGGGFAVAHDMRPSSPALAGAFSDGLRDQGVDVTSLGLASTDGLYYAAGVLDVPGAMFTASHNPAAYNGIKLCRAGASPVSIDTGLAAIRDLAEVDAPEPAGTRGSLAHLDLTARYAAHVRSFVDADLLAGLEVVVDAGNGMAGHIWPAIAEGLPLTTVPLHFTLDGTFPNHPANPLEPENLADVIAEVVRRGAPLGLAFDGDADRVMAVDETGHPVSSSLVGAVIAERLLARSPGATVLHNLICSHSVREAILEAGGVPERTRVGHSFIKERMAATDAVLGVEHSGHFYFRDNYRADSGAIAALLLLEAVAVAGAPLSEVVARFDRYPASGERNHEVLDVAATIARVETAFATRARLDHLDGLTVELEDGWFNLRASNTEPLLRLNVEARDAATLRSLHDEVVALIGTDAARSDHAPA